MTFRRLYAFVALVIGATAIMISISGCATRLLVVSGYTRAIHRYNGSTGAPLGIFVPASSGGLALPWERVFGPDGKVYVTSTTAFSADTLGVLRYDGRTGVFVDVFVALLVARRGAEREVGINRTRSCHSFARIAWA